MISKIRHIRLLAFITNLVIFSFSAPLFAVDDGARAFWKAREGSTVLSFQYLNLNMQASGAEQFAPGQYIYPNSDVEGNVVLASWARHMTIFNRASSFAVSLSGGSVQADIGASLPSEFLPPGATPNVALANPVPDTPIP